LQKRSATLALSIFVALPIVLALTYPEPRCNQDEPVHELGHAAFRRSYVEDEERQRNREDGVANPFCPVGSIISDRYLVFPRSTNHRPS